MSRDRPGSRGRVILLGAGPGDPDLITVRGADALTRADAVVYDALVSLDVLERVPASAQLFNVGKRGHDPPTRSQDDINALLVRLAREGKTVVRLKGGDPFVFGRGGEEASACAEAGVPFEVIPGVTSAFATLAYAGIPITDRRYGASFAVVTGHQDPTEVTKAIRWGALVEAVDTLVILMGMKRIETLVGRLLEHRSPNTPAAVIMWGTTPRQRVVAAPLGELVSRVEASGLGTPAAIVIGDVVRLRETLSWYERLPLFGHRVVVTRSEEQAGLMLDALRRAGAEPILLPMLGFEGPAESAEVDAAVRRLSAYDAVIFTSQNAVRFFAAAVARAGRSLDEVEGRVWCVGPATRRSAAAAGLASARIPTERFDAEGLLEGIVEHFAPAGRRLLIPRVADAREVLPAGLRERGATVDAVTFYRSLPPVWNSKVGRELRQRLAARELDTLTFASPSAVRNCLALLDAAARAALPACTIAAIGPVTAEELRRQGIEPDVMPARALADELVDALAAHALARGTAEASVKGSARGSAEGSAKGSAKASE